MILSLAYITRGRSSEVLFSFCSFLMQAHNNRNIEYLFIIDKDDTETIEMLDKVLILSQYFFASVSTDPRLYPKIKYIKSKKRYGYQELEQYQNLAAKHFMGDCLIILNDDVLCIQKDWDKRFFEGMENLDMEDPILIRCKAENEPYATMYGINRKWYELTKRFSGSRDTEQYLSRVYEEVDRELKHEAVREMNKYKKFPDVFEPRIFYLHISRNSPLPGSIYTEGVPVAHTQNQVQINRDSVYPKIEHEPYEGQDWGPWGPDGENITDPHVLLDRLPADDIGGNGKVEQRTPKHGLHSSSVADSRLNEDINVIKKHFEGKDIVQMSKDLD
tara:strand:+ start:208 stop:1200 length:993 start_codon:yes stop_codon:yes gene_type:complete